ncbi:MAG: repeat-associated core domain [Acidobacteria bacterium]|nr:repeat-associated core domain [Acidobacteriota bacterium]
MSKNIFARSPQGLVRRIIVVVLTTSILFTNLPSIVAQTTTRGLIQQTNGAAERVGSLARVFGSTIDNLGVQALALILGMRSANKVLATSDRSSREGTTDGGHMPPRPAMGPAVTPQQPASREDREARIVALRLNTTDDFELQSHQRIFLSAIPVDAEGAALHGSQAEWDSNNSGVVIVDSNGEAVAGRPGNALLRARVGRVTRTIHVRVVDGDLDEFGNNRRIGRSAKVDSIRGNALPLLGKAVMRTGWRERHHSVARGRVSPLIALVKPAPAPPTENPLPDTQTDSLYSPSNSLGSPTGKTVPGAETPPPALPATENPGSQNFTFGLPVFSLRGRGMDAALSLVHNSQLFNKSSDGTTTYMTYDVDSGWPAAGWRLGFGQIESQGSNSFTLTDPDGTRHQLVYSSGYDFNTIDSSFIHFNLSTRILDYPDGTQLTYHAFGTGTKIYPVKIVDRNGNKIEISYVGGVGPKIDTITDTLSRYITFSYASGDLVSITAPGLGSGSRVVMRLYYDDPSLSTSGLFASATPANIPSSGQAHVIKYIYLPDSSESGGAHTGYKFEYTSYGMMYKITKFRGMSAASDGSGLSEGTNTTAAWTIYNYPGSSSRAIPSGGMADTPDFTEREDEWAGRTTNGPAPKYLFSSGTVSGHKEFTVTSPPPLPAASPSPSPAESAVTESRTIDHPGYWDDGLVDNVTQKDGVGNAYTRTGIEWEQDSAGNPRVHVQWVTNSRAILTKATVFSYTTYNNVSAISERAYTTSESALGSEVRRTEITYAHETSSSYISRHLLHLPATVKVFEGGSSTPSSRTDYEYDNYSSGGTSLTGRSSITMHEDAFDPSKSSYNSATDLRGNVTKVTNYPDATSTSGTIAHKNTYDIAGNLVSEEVDCCQKKAFTYTDSSGSHDFAYVASVTSGNPGGVHLTSSATYDLPTGLVGTVTDENGQVTTIYYSSDSLRLSYVVEPTGRETHHYYYDGLIADSAGHRHYYSNVYTKINTTGTAKYDWVDYYQFYDGRGAVKQEFYDGTGDGGTTDEGWNSHVFRYDNLGRAVLRTNPFHTGGYGGGLHVDASSGEPITTTKYDVVNRATDTYMPTGEGSTTTTTAHVNVNYDGYDSGYDGIQTTVTDAASRLRRQKVDVLGRLVRLDEPDPTTGSLLASDSSLAQPTSYEYDILGNLEHISQGSQHRYFGYDSLGRLKLEKQVEQYGAYYTYGAIRGNHDWSRKLNYNSSGQVTDSYDAKGTRSHFTYDDLNRLTQVQYFVGDSSTAQGTPTMTYTYDQARTGYLNAGRLTTIATANVGSTPSTSTEYDYDLVGRVTAQRQSVGSTTYTMAYAYTLGSMLASETYPSGHLVSYQYGYAGKPINVQRTVSSTTTTLADNFGFAPHGGLTSESWANGATQTRTYNRALKPSQLKLVSSSAVIQQYDYAYGTFSSSTGNVAVDENTGQLGKITSTLGSGSGSVQWMQGFKYDKVGRLSNITEYPTAGVSGTQNFSQDYTYDRYGNKKQSANTTLGLPAVSDSDYQNSNNNNRFVSTVAAYDDNGNITQDFKFHAQTYQYAYDANGRQTSASNGTWTEAQVYDGSGQRVQTSVDGVTRTIVYDILGQNVGDYSYVGSGLERENFYRSGQLLATQEFPTTQNVVWTGASGVTVSGNSITKSGTTGWGYSGAISSQAIVSGDGYAEFTADSLDYGMYGLSHDNPDRNFTGIDYAIYTERAEGRVYVYENGTNLGQKGTWTSGDRFRVAVEGGVVKYYKNTTMLYSSSVSPTYPLFVDTSLYNGSTLSNVVISGDLTGAGLRYVLQDIQGTARVVMNGNSSAVPARHDYLPLGEEISNSIGARSATGYGGTDANRWDYGLTERDQTSGLDHTWFRKYESKSGRWTSPDPYRGSIVLANPQTFNRYSYVRNDAMNLLDPTGLDDIWLPPEYVTVYPPSYSFIAGGNHHGSLLGVDGEKGSAECAQMRERLLGDPNTAAGIDAAWTRSQATAQHPKREEGGLFGKVVATRSTIDSIFQREGNAQGSLAGFGKWAQRKVLDSRGLATFEFWYHTHPHEAGEEVPGEGKAINPEFPTGNDGDIGVSKDLGIPGILITKKHVTVFDKDGFIRCYFDR